MLFNTWEFGLFLVVVLVAYYASARVTQNRLLLVASYVFYGWWDWRFLGLIVISTFVDYGVGLALGRTSAPVKRKRLLLLSVCVNLGILGFFKYFNFFIESTGAVLEAAGLNAHLPVLSIVLPVGISFYTFQTMAYTIDVYRGRQDPVRSLEVFALYVCFFPQLVAGPIERAQHLLPQFERSRHVNVSDVSEGVQLILIGLVRKVLIADIAAGEVDKAFGSVASMDAFGATRAVLLFSLQIYGDFAGYSDIARGVSKLLGVDLMRNFEQPYLSQNLAEFWRRWHISLSTWLRDYLYIPLGGNRHGTLGTYRNLMLTMLLGGLWHGASWNFVIWGAIHGVALAIHRAAGGTAERRAKSLVGTTWRWLLTMLVVAFAWVFFRAPDFPTATHVLAALTQPGRLVLGAWLLPAVLLVVSTTIDLIQNATGQHAFLSRLPAVPRGLVYAAAILALCLFRPDTDVQFIYFQF